MASWEPNPANTSCVTDADCTSISDRYNCFNSFCACVFTEQLVSSDPENGKYCDTGSFVYIGGFIMDLLALNWLGVIPLHTGIATAAHLILRYVDLSLQAPSLAPPRMIGASIVARFSTRVAPTEMAPPKSGFVDREPSAYKSATAADVAKSERERRPSLDDEEEAAMEAKYEAFKAAKEAAEKEAALRASRAP